MADLVARKLPLRHPAENPTFILMVVLNFVILAVLIDFLTTGLFGPADTVDQAHRSQPVA